MRMTLIASLLLAPALSAQTLQPRAVVVLGGATADPNDELVRVSAARRLPDGRIVVALGDPLEMRVYDRTGKILNRIGRRGGGPGEFRAPLSIPHADNDSITTYTDGHNRLAVFAPDGKLIHEREQRVNPTPPLLLRRALLHAPNGIANGCARSVIMALPLVTPANLYEVFPDRSGHFWVHALHDPTWRVYSQAGPLLGTITLPRGARVLDSGTGYMLVHLRDADDLEQVVEFRVDVPAGPARPPCAARRDAFPLVSSDNGRAAELKQVIKDVMVANEVAFSNTSYYPRTADSLQLKPAGGIVVGVIEGGRGGYANVVLDTRTTLACVIQVGSGSFRWPEAVTFCGS
jgi:hypothetical protein